jgi:hypothetical protein
MRPLELGETIDASIKIVRARWKTLATVMLVIALPAQIADVVIIRATTDDYHAGAGFQDTAAGGQVAIFALGFLSYLLGTVACYRAVADTYRGRETSARASLAFAADRLGATLWLTILLVVGVSAGLILFLVPGLWLAIAWAVAYPVMLVEGTGGIPALRRSSELVRGRWWATFGRIGVAFIMVFVLWTVVAGVFAAPIGDDPSLGALVLESIGNVIVSLVTTPFLAAVTTLVYFDLRLRRDGVVPEGGAPEPPHPEPTHPEPPLPGGWAPPVAPEPRSRDEA